MTTKTTTPTKAEQLITALKDAGYRDARFLIVSTKRVDLMVEAAVSVPRAQNPSDEKLSPHPVIEFPVDLATRKQKVITVLAAHGLRPRGQVHVLPPRIVVEDVPVDVGQATLAANYNPPEEAAPVVDAASVEPKVEAK